MSSRGEALTKLAVVGPGCVERRMPGCTVRIAAQLTHSFPCCSWRGLARAALPPPPVTLMRPQRCGPSCRMSSSTMRCARLLPLHCPATVRSRRTRWVGGWMGAAGTWPLVLALVVGWCWTSRFFQHCSRNTARARRTKAVMQHTPHARAQRASLCPNLQALAALLVCEAADDCHGALRVVEQWVPAGDRCLLHLDARHLGTDKGALQVRSTVCCLDAVACAGFGVLGCLLRLGAGHLGLGKAGE